jgi:hypothetical protein
MGRVQSAPEVRVYQVFHHVPVPSLERRVADYTAIDPGYIRNSTGIYEFFNDSLYIVSLPNIARSNPETRAMIGVSVCKLFHGLHSAADQTKLDTKSGKRRNQSRSKARGCAGDQDPFVLPEIFKRGAHSAGTTEFIGRISS